MLTADSRLHRSPEAMPHFSTLLQLARRPVPKMPSGAYGEEEASPELPMEDPRGSNPKPQAMKPPSQRRSSIVSAPAAGFKMSTSELVTKRFSFLRRRWDAITRLSLEPAASSFGELGEEGPHSTTAGSSLAHRVPSRTRGLPAHSLSPRLEQAGEGSCSDEVVIFQLHLQTCHKRCLSPEWGWPVERGKARSVVRADASHWCYYASKTQVSCLSTTDGAAQRLLLRSRRKSPKKPGERPPDPVAMDALSVLMGNPLPGLGAGSSIFPVMPKP